MGLKERIFPYAILVLIAFLFYVHILNFGYTYLDDASLIIESHRQFTAAPFSVFQIFFKNTLTDLWPELYYRPVFAASFMLNSLLSPDNLSGYYLINILLQAVTAGLIFMLLAKLRYTRATAFFLSLFYVIHPMMVSAVAWLPGRADTLVTTFCLASFIALINFLEKRSFVHYALHLFFLLVALFSKESALCLFAIFFCYIHFIRRPPWSSFEKRILLPGWLLTLSFYLLLRSMALIDHAPLTIAKILTMLQFAAANSIVLLQYLGRIFFPWDLSVWPTPQDSPWITGAIAIFVLFAALSRSKDRKMGSVLFGIVWFILFLVPTLTGPNSGPAACFFNYRACLSMPGIMIVLAEIDAIKHFSFKKRGLLLGATCVWIFYVLTAYKHSYIYSNSTAFWENARLTSPHFWQHTGNAKPRNEHPFQ